MRPVALFIVCLCVATSAEARPQGRHSPIPPQIPQQVDLSAGTTLRGEVPIEDIDAPILHRPALSSPSNTIVDVPHLEIGALTPEFSHGGEGLPQLGQYKLQGAAVLGSSMEGSIDRHGAELNFVWPLSR